MHYNLVLLDAGVGYFYMFMGIPFLIGLFIIGGAIISKTIAVIQDEISRKDSISRDLAAKEKENENNEQS